MMASTVPLWPLEVHGVSEFQPESWMWHEPIATEQILMFEAVGTTDRTFESATGRMWLRSPRS